MNLCSDNHEEVCFEARKCPFCECMEDFISKETRLHEEIESLNSEIKSLEDNVRELEIAAGESGDI